MFPRQGTIVKVRCDNSRIVELVSGEPTGINQICPPVIISPTFRPGELKPRPGGNQEGIPYVISPRMTYVMENRPTFRWNSVSGATEYIVSLHGPGGQEWEKAVSSTTLTYPSQEESLAENTKYVSELPL